MLARARVVSDGCAAIVQSDRSVLVKVDHPGYEAARQVLVRCAELEKSPEHIHTYRLSDLSLYNAASAGESAEQGYRYTIEDDDDPRAEREAYDDVSPIHP